VEITSAENSAEHATLWIAKTSRKAAKMLVAMPQMNGAELTAELQ
jgi:DNA-binding NarL/FixJ family response regulator